MDENCAVLGYYTAISSNSLSTFRDNRYVVPKCRLGINPTRCAIAQKSAALEMEQVHFVWNCNVRFKYSFIYSFIHSTKKKWDAALAIIKLQTADFFFLIFHATNVLRKMKTGINKPHATNREQSPSFGVHSLELFVSRQTVVYEECIWNKNVHIWIDNTNITRIWVL